jgi:hypothetical protein
MSLIIKVNAKYQIITISMKLATIGIRPRIPKIEMAKVTTISAHIAVMSFLLGIDP